MARCKPANHRGVLEGVTAFTATLPLTSLPWGALFPSEAQSPYRARPLGMIESENGRGDEKNLVEAAQRGDREAVRALLDRFSRTLYTAVILPRVGNVADAEEVLRDALMRAVERIDTFHWTPAGFFPWLRQIAINLVIDQVRRNQRKHRLEERLEQQANEVLPMHRADAEVELIEAQERAAAMRAMQSAMSTLSERYRRAVELRLIEEKSREDCALAMGVTVGNFDVIFHRAVAALRKAYGVR